MIGQTGNLKGEFWARDDINRTVKTIQMPGHKQEREGLPLPRCVCSLHHKEQAGGCSKRTDGRVWPLFPVHCYPVSRPWRAPSLMQSLYTLRAAAKQTNRGHLSIWGSSCFCRRSVNAEESAGQESARGRTSTPLPHFKHSKRNSHSWTLTPFLKLAVHSSEILLLITPPETQTSLHKHNVVKTPSCCTDGYHRCTFQFFWSKTVWLVKFHKIVNSQF